MLLYAYVHNRIANFYGGGLCNSALRQPAIRRLLPVWHGRTSTCAQNTGFYANGQIRVAFRESVSVLGTFMGSGCFFLLRINGGIRLIFILKHLRFAKLLFFKRMSILKIIFLCLLCNYHLLEAPQSQTQSSILCRCWHLS